MKNVIIALVVAVFGSTAIFADHHEMPKTDAAAPTEAAPAAEATAPAPEHKEHKGKKAKKAKKAKKEHKAEEHKTEAAPAPEAVPAH